MATPEERECADVLERMYAFLDGELDEDAADHIRHHLNACEACLDHADIAAALKALVRRCYPDQHAPDSLRLRVSQVTHMEYRSVQIRATDL